MGRSRSRHRSHDRSERRHSKDRSKEPGKPAATTASGSPLDDARCVRFGVVNPRGSLTKEQIRDEIDAVKLSSKVVDIKIEDRDPQHPKIHWARIYFMTPEDADAAITELNIPNRQSKWRNFVSQRLPVPGPFSGIIGGDPTFEVFIEDPADTLVIETQEGYVHISTDEVYKSKGIEDFVQAKSMGKVIRRLICKHYDPHRRVHCKFGLSCGFVHIKADVMNRLLRPVTHKLPLRPLKNAEEIQTSIWEFERRKDTLVVRYMDRDMTLQDLKYMFEACAGFQECFLRRKDEMVFGIVRFQSHENACTALMQTFDSNLNISFYGTIEDIRLQQIHAARQGVESAPTAEDRKRPRAPEDPNALPFPPLPTGWGHGVSRTTHQYYFFKIGSKDERTTWKHPTTNESYHER